MTPLAAPASAAPPADQAQALRRLASALTPGAGEGEVASRARLVAVTSGKGGVGKTLSAVNLSIALSQLGKLVTLVDADLGTANADLLCGIIPARRLENGLAAARLEDVAVIAPGGFRLIAGSSGIARMADLDEAERERLVDRIRDVRRTSDIVILDTGAGIGAGVLDLVRCCDVGVVVATPEPTSIADAYALIKCVVRGSSSPVRLMLLVNQAAHRDEALRVHDRIARVAARFLDGYGVDWLGWLPADPRFRRAVRDRRPILLAAPWSRPSRRLREAARHLLSAVEPPIGVRDRGGVAPSRRRVPSSDQIFSR